ncbi:hypothetical protein NDU88_002889 [Pleurodeles waltl]|uniref:Uncharacterized protein n=1 Tax=Pleurodeles waltl TaxID=8319 RepID=A0AAV7RCA4_PLEWA|nr:hypothetical protein NDU88_002889 [Pleurodeles waltl]
MACVRRRQNPSESTAPCMVLELQAQMERKFVDPAYPRPILNPYMDPWEHFPFLIAGRLMLEHRGQNQIKFVYKKKNIDAFHAQKKRKTYKMTRRKKKFIEELQDRRAEIDFMGKKEAKDEREREEEKLKIAWILGNVWEEDQ